MKLFKVLILAIFLPFAKLSVYLFEEGEQTFPSYEHSCVCDEIHFRGIGYSMQLKSWATSKTFL